MTKQTINVGSGEYAGDGESLRSALVKTNENFTEVYTSIDTINNAGYLTAETLPPYPTVQTDQLTSGTAVLKLTSDGILTLPVDGSISGSTAYGIESVIDGYNSGVYFDANHSGSGNAILYATKNAIIRADNNGTFKDWLFGEDGNLTFPDHTIQTTAYTGSGDRITSGTVAVYVTDDGRLNLPRGSVVFNNTTSVVVSLDNITLQQVLDYSTSGGDYVAIGAYGNENPYNAPYTVIRLATTPPEPLFQGDILAGPGFPVPTTILYAGTGTFTDTLILDCDFTALTVPVPPVAIVVSRPTVNDSLTIESADGVDLVLKPGGSRNTIIHNNLVPYNQYGSSLGSPVNRFKNLYMGAGTIYLKDEITDADVVLTSQNNLFTILGSGGLNVGEFTFQDNQIKLTDPTRDIIIGATTATAYVQFNRPVRMTNASGSTTFQVTRNGRVQIDVANVQAGDEGALNIVGSTSGDFQPITNSGGMIHVTNDSGSTRLNLDNFGTTNTTSTFSVITGRSGRGNAATPSQTKSGDILLRIGAVGWKVPSGFGGATISSQTLDLVAEEDFYDNSRGTAFQFYNAPVGGSARLLSSTIDSTGLVLTANTLTTIGITFPDNTKQTTAFTGTVDVSLINNLGTVAVTEVIAGVGLSGGGMADTISLDNTGVLSMEGTANQISVNGNTTATNGFITLSLPQDIAPTSNVTFNDVNITGQLNLLSTTTILIPSTVEGTILYLGSSATNVSQLDGGGIQLGNTTTGIASILWNRNNNYWDFDGSGINTQQLIATDSTLTNLKVIGSGKFGIPHEDNTYANALLQVDNDVNSYGQILNVNHSHGTQSSSDIVAVNDIGNDGSYFIDMGINGSNYNTSTWKVNGANDGYLYVQDGNLAIGTTQDRIVFFTNGTLAGNIEATITDGGLNVVNTVTSAGFFGPLTGNVTGDVTGNVSGNAGSVTNGVYVTGNYNNPSWLTGLAGSKITSAVATATTVVNGVYTTDTGSVTNNMLAGSIANNKLAFNQITFTAGTGIGVSVASPSLGGSTTISNTGVTSITTGSGIFISTSTGEIVISAAVPQGPIGYTGSAGTNGTNGATGFTGSAGTNGTNGATGTQGNVGFTGSQGIQGIQGVIGYTGSTGTQGVIGYTGSTGTQGITGFTGSTGTQGVIGYTGSTGTQGVIGYTGSTGTQGVIGYTGSKGVADVYVASVSTGTGIFVTTSTGAVTISLNTSTLMTQAISLVGVTSIVQGSTSIDFASVAKNSASSQVFTINGLTTSHHIIVQPAAAMTFGLMVTAAWASAANSATIQVMNLTGGAIDQAAINVNYFAWI